MNSANQCISYLDESKHFNFGPTNSVDYYTIVSITAKYNDYISIIEPQWRVLRIKHGIPDGHTLHFTSVRLLLNPSLPFEKYNADLLQIFSKTRSPISKDIDYTRLHAFFLDVMNFISTQPLVIQATGIKYDKAGIIRNIHNQYFKDSTYRPPYHAFKEHMDLMALYLMNLQSGLHEPKKFLFTKLRFDGDADFGERDDLREAFNHCIALGTRHFRPILIKKVFDEIRFVGKGEVAQASTGGITHAGNEITDFLAVIVSRHIWGIESTKNPLIFPGLAHPLDPIPFVAPKIFNSQCLADNFI